MHKISIDLNGNNDVYFGIVNSILGPKRHSMIDLCCCNATMTRQLGFRYRTYVDVLPRDLGSEQQYFVEADVLGDHPVLAAQYDVSICSDGIEHVTKEQGFALVEKMKSISKKQVLFTPLDPWMMSSPEDTNPESHKSLWAPEDLPDFAHVVLPVYHPTLNIGAFFFWKVEDLDQDFARVVNELESNPIFAGHITKNPV